MSESFKDIAQHLRDKPSIRWSGDTPLLSMWFRSETIPVELFKPCPEIVDSQSRVTYRFNNALDGQFITFEAGGDSYRILIDTTTGDPVTPTEIPGETIFSARIPDGYSEDDIGKFFIPFFDAVDGVRAYFYDSEGVPGLHVYDLDTGRNVNLSGTAISGADPASNFSVVQSFFPKGYRIGDHYDKCPHMIIEDVWIEGSDDTHLNIMLILKPDLLLLSEQSDDINFPDVVANVGLSTTHPYFDTSKSFSWEFDVPNATKYRRAPAGTPHPHYPNAVLINEQSIRNGSSAVVTRTYHTIAPESEQTKFSYNVGYECQDGENISSRYPLVTVRLNVELQDFSPALCGSLCPVNGDNALANNSELDFSSLSSLVLIEPPTLEPLNTVYGTVVMQYARVPGWESRDLANDNQVCDIEIYSRRVLAGASKPQRGDDYNGRTVWDSRIEQVNCCVAQQRVTVTTIPSPQILSHTFNPETGELEEVFERVVLSSDLSSHIENIQEDGDYTTSRALNCDFSVITNRVAAPFIDRTYQTVINYNWPRVLDFIEILTWVRNDGGERFHPRVEYLRYQYNGPTLATIRETWSVNKPTPANVKYMQTTSVIYSCPFYSVNTGPCLHGDVTLRCDIGNNDPIWDQNQSSARNTEATNYTDWPSTLLITDSVDPGFGGWIRRRVTVHKPDPTV